MIPVACACAHKMKLREIRTFVVGNPPPHNGGRYFVFAKLTTADGISGVGEAYGVPFDPHQVARLIEDVFARYLEGEDPHDVERIWRRVYSSGYSQHPDLTVMGVLSALEMACWDIIGKAAGQPVYKLLGGRVHERLRTYTYIYARPEDRTDVYQDPDLAAERAAEYLAQGFTALKFDPLGPYSAFDGRQPSLAALERCERFMRQLRAAVGSRADLLFGTHGQMTAAGAIRLARRIEPYDPLWFEEPVPPDAPEEMARVARASGLPIAAGERLTTKYDFARLLEAGGAAHPAAESRSRGRAAGGEEDRGAGRSAACADRSAPVLRSGGGRSQHSARHVQPELPHPRGDRALAGACTRSCCASRSAGKRGTSSPRPSRGSASSSMRPLLWRIPIRARRCTWKWRTSP